MLCPAANTGFIAFAKATLPVCRCKHLASPNQGSPTSKIVAYTQTLIVEQEFSVRTSIGGEARANHWKFEGLSVEFRPREACSVTRKTGKPGAAMRVLGIDGGSKRVGVALSDDLCLTAQPLATIAAGSDAGIVDRIRDVLGDVAPDLVVVGLPLRLDGSEGGAARAARKMADLLGETLGVPVELWDERLTSVQAERVLIEAGMGRRKRKQGATDRVAAAIMLQSFLDAHRDRWQDDDR